MIIEEIGRGASVEDATEDAKLKLGVRDDEDIQVDIISLPKKKVMGLFGGSCAEVKVSVERPDEKPAKKQPAKKKEVAKKEGNKPQNTKKEQHKEPKKEESQPKQRAASTEPALEKAVSADQLPADSRAAKAAAYLGNVLSKLGVEKFEMKVNERNDGATIFLEGEGLGIIIGRRGETLDALQHLVSLSARNNQGYYKVTLNIGDYRERREDTLSSLAKRVADQVIKTGKGKALEPMNPYERRIIHTTIQGIEGIKSESVGDGDNRRVVILPEGENVSSVRINHRKSGGRDRDRRGGNRNGGRDRRRSSAVVTAPSREPKSDSDVPLYGKIK